MKVFKQQKDIACTHKNYVSGFTLIEVMVAVSVFAIVITVGIGSLMTVNKGYRQSQLQRSAIDNISFAMESMTREIRIGDSYTIGSSLDFNTEHENNSGSEFTFLSFDISDDGEIVEIDDTVSYSLYQNNNNQGVIRMKIGNLEQDLTSPNVDVTDLNFILEEKDGGQDKQPYLTIHITAKALRGGQESEIVMQTGVSQRKVNKF